MRFREPFETPPTYRYAIPINEGTRNEEGEVTGSVTVAIVTVEGWWWRRRALMRNFLKHNYGLTRAQAEESLRALGFYDLYTCDV